MNQPYARVNQPHATLTLASALREMFGVQLYKNNARALLSRILSILNLDWLQHARSVRGVYEVLLKGTVEITWMFVRIRQSNILQRKWPWSRYKSKSCMIFVPSLVVLRRLDVTWSWVAPAPPVISNVEVSTLTVVSAVAGTAREATSELVIFFVEVSTPTVMTVAVTSSLSVIDCVDVDVPVTFSE